MKKIKKSGQIKIRGYSLDNSPYLHGYSKRIYFIYGKPNEIIENILTIDNEINIEGNLVLLEINTSELNFKFYKDTYSAHECACYCFNAIPLKYIKRVFIKNNKILDYKEK